MNSKLKLALKENFSIEKRATLLVIVAFLGLPAIDAIAKVLATSIPAGQVAWTRFVFQTVLMAPFFLRAVTIRKPQYLFLQTLRGILIASTTVLIFAAVKLMSLAEVISIFFVEPLLVTLF